MTEAGSELGDQISVISSEKQKKGGGLTHQLSDVSRFASTGWHADITFEPVPSDYAMLKIHTLPPTGGDTVSLAQHKSMVQQLSGNSSGRQGMRYMIDYLQLCSSSWKG